jgi:putative oxidoreductase
LQAPAKIAGFHRAGFEATRSPLEESNLVGFDFLPSISRTKDCVMKTVFLLGRLIFGGFFLYSGIHHFQEKKSMAQYAAAKNVPVPDLAIPATGALLLLGGASVLLGVKPKIGTLAIMGFLAGVTPMIHDFWTSEDPQRRQTEMAQFMKNVALFGAAMTLMGVEEPWPVSVPIGQPSRLDLVKKYVRRVAA